jgi:hypothetical protein
VNILVPWPIALGKVDSAARGAPTSLNCATANQVITPQETRAMVVAESLYNVHIAQVAQTRGWAYWDVNPLFTALRTSGAIPAFPDVNGAFANPRTSILFGPIFSLDGVHPSSAAHRVAADSLAHAINRTYGPNGTKILKDTLPVPVCGAAVVCPSPI